MLTLEFLCDKLLLVAKKSGGEKSYFKKVIDTSFETCYDVKVAKTRQYSSLKTEQKPSEKIEIVLFR